MVIIKSRYPNSNIEQRFSIFFKQSNNHTEKPNLPNQVPTQNITIFNLAQFSTILVIKFFSSLCDNC